MPNATSSFLQGVNAAAAAKAAGSSSAGTPIDDASVLAAISRLDINDIAALASKLDVGQARVAETVTRLTRRGLVEEQNDELSLSESGKRALRYIDMAKL